MQNLSGLRARPMKKLLTPNHIKSAHEQSEPSAETVLRGRQEIEAILDGRDSRMLIICGPCSIHDKIAALEYAKKLAQLRARYQEKLCIVMRVYFEKPRTVTGWKGLINDPYLDDTFHIDEGRLLAREILCRITELGLPAATELLDAMTPQFLDDLLSWAAIGARTVEAQMYREMASGLSMPVGFKNGTSGDIKIAVDAILSALTPHHFAGFDGDGSEHLFETQGNPFGHLILRGGSSGPNFTPTKIAEAVRMLAERNLASRVIVDCSHANAERDYGKQWVVLQNLVSQRNRGNHAIVGAMIESNLFAGKQDISAKPLKYGVSITDACVGWDETETMLKSAFDALE